MVCRNNLPVRSIKSVKKRGKFRQRFATERRTFEDQGIFILLITYLPVLINIFLRGEEISPENERMYIISLKPLLLVLFKLKNLDLSKYVSVRRINTF